MLAFLSASLLGPKSTKTATAAAARSNDDQHERQEPPKAIPHRQLNAYRSRPTPAGVADHFVAEPNDGRNTGPKRANNRPPKRPATKKQTEAPKAKRRPQRPTEITEPATCPLERQVIL